MAQKSDLPFGSEFSPSQIVLATLLDLAFIHEGDVAALESAIQNQFFSAHGRGSAKNQKILAMNCRLGMKAYGVIDHNARLTELGQRLYALRHSEQQLHEALARHILLNLRGMSLVQCIRDMTAAGEEINLTSLRRSLAARGIHYPAGGKHPSIMRLWLEKAGVFAGNRWQIDDSRLRAVLGADPASLDVLSHLNVEQRAFLRALVNSGVSDP